MDHPEWTPEQRVAVMQVEILRMRRDVRLSHFAEIQHMARTTRAALNRLDPPAETPSFTPLDRPYAAGGSAFLPAAAADAPSRHPATAVAGNLVLSAEPSA